MVTADKYSKGFKAKLLTKEIAYLVEEHLLKNFQPSFKTLISVVCNTPKTEHIIIKYVYPSCRIKNGKKCCTQYFLLKC